VDGGPGADGGASDTASPTTKAGCGCDVVGLSANAWGGIGLAAGVGAMLARRRRSRNG
jgi:hypothetical protein